eukprot:scaffold210149_cov33-Tisochrysis_lutea.AAC.3
MRRQERMHSCQEQLAREQSKWRRLLGDVCRSITVAFTYRCLGTPNRTTLCMPALRLMSRNEESEPNKAQA